MRVPPLKSLESTPDSDPESPVCEPNLIIEKLPYDIWRVIFEYLSLRELIDCRRVCKTFRSVVDSTRFRELVVFDAFWRKLEKTAWWNSDRPVHTRNSINVLVYDSFSGCENVLDSPGFQMLCVSLKFLSLKIDVWGLYFETLNSFVELEELTIEKVICSKHRRYPVLCLNLPNLKKLAFSLFYGDDHRNQNSDDEYSVSADSESSGSDDFSYDSSDPEDSNPRLHSPDPRLVLDTPLLEAVKVERNLHLVRFKYTETVKYLQVEKCQRTFEMLEQFIDFENLECFSCTDPAFLTEFHVLKFKPTLKRINCLGRKSKIQFEVIERLLKQKSKKNLPVEIYYEGYLVDSIFELKKHLMELDKLKNDAENEIF